MINFPTGNPINPLIHKNDDTRIIISVPTGPHHPDFNPHHFDELSSDSETISDEGDDGIMISVLTGPHHPDFNPQLIRAQPPQVQQQPRVSLPQDLNANWKV